MWSQMISSCILNKEFFFSAEQLTGIILCFYKPTETQLICPSQYNYYPIYLSQILDKTSLCFRYFIHTPVTVYTASSFLLLLSFNADYQLWTAGQALVFVNKVLLEQLYPLANSLRAVYGCSPRTAELCSSHKYHNGSQSLNCLYYLAL